MKYLALLLLFIGLINCTGKSSSDDSGDKTVKIENNEQIEPKDEFLITPQKLKSMLKNREDIIIIDVRTDEEVASGVILQPKTIDYNNPGFREQILELDTDRKYLVYCHAGSRSARARKILNAAGFNNVYDLKGGMAAWREARYDTETLDSVGK